MLNDRYFYLAMCVFALAGSVAVNHYPSTAWRDIFFFLAGIVFCVFLSLSLAGGRS
jgi:hypothetical protein